MEAMIFMKDSKKEKLRQKLENTFNPKQAFLLADIITDAYEELVKTSDFNELKSIVKELAQAQKETKQELKELAQAQKGSEQRITSIEVTMKELVEAQKETTQELKELAQAQKETKKELKELAQDQKGIKQELKELAQAQKETNKELKELAQDQKGIKQELKELAQAQKQTQEELRDLVGEHKETRKQIGGLSTTFGYQLEDEAYKALPELLKRDYGIIVTSRIKRQYVKDSNGQEIEVNIVGEATRNGKKIMLIGEGKSQLSINGINDFIRKKLKRLEGVYDVIFPILITYMISSSDVEEYAKSTGIALYYSYDFI